MFKKIKILALLLSAGFLLGTYLLPTKSSFAAQTSVSDEIVTEVSAVYADGEQSCTGKKAGSVSPNSNKPETSGLMDVKILEDMQKFLRLIYKELSQVFMLGNALICYAVKVDYFCFGLESITGCLIKFPNFSFLISGVVIYVVAAFMTFSIGMYFVDISFKLGFAMLFLPISIALWPFAPTQSKFTDNLSIIIRNAMLFVLVAVGVAYAVTLISNGVFEGGWDAFWTAIENRQTEMLSENFAIDSIHILVIAFSLIYGFKILASSVNDYLDSLFNDAVFGGASPMHHMGTQAFGTFAENTIKPAADFVGDVARVGAGKAIVGGVNLASKVGSSEGRKEISQGISKAAHDVGNAAQAMVKPLRNPIQTYHAAQEAFGRGLNKAVHGVGEFAKSAHDNITAFAPMPLSEALRQKQVKAVNEFVDKVTDTIGDWAEANVPGSLERGAKSVITAAAAGIHNINNPDDQIDKDEMRARLHAGKEEVFDAVDSAVSSVEQGISNTAKTVGGAIGSAATATGQFIGGIAQKAGEGIKEGAKQAVTGVATSLHNDIAGLTGHPENYTDTAGMRAVLHMDKEKAKAFLKDVYQTSDQARITLQPSALISAPFKAAIAVSPFNIYGTVKKLVKTGKEIKNEAQSEPHFILKRSGQIVMRTIKGTGQDIKGVASFAGNALKDFGTKLQDNSKRQQERQAKREQGHRSWAEQDEALEKAQREERDLWSEAPSGQDQE